jgi:hypothetical protein
MDPVTGAHNDNYLAQWRISYFSRGLMPITGTLLPRAEVRKTWLLVTSPSRPGTIQSKLLLAPLDLSIAI